MKTSKILGCILLVGMFIPYVLPKPAPLTPEQIHEERVNDIVKRGYFDCERTLKRNLKDDESWKSTSNHYHGSIKDGKIQYVVEGKAKIALAHTVKLPFSVLTPPRI